ncbi:Cell division control protein 73 [Babesia sp. Xinjiang]|uniref:Cell division control protein 73 n=1 Tax=Babesia sp. Xinjiang TaxID=462227 RepID=UPI000A24CE3D|nr:Cell division control protein 73 [Babesia sp. Xinjiang]ORM41424.1 Cell division control protein 73 [Babesia sp. Xinjiang]
MDGSQDLFDGSWDVRTTHVLNTSYWSDKASISSIALLKSLCSNGSMVEFAMEPPGVLVCRIPEQNVTVNMLDPSGLCNRRGEMYTIGDVVLLLCIRRSEYTYSSISNRGFRYINVLERDRIKSILCDSETSPELLEAKTRYISIYKDPSCTVPGSKDPGDGMCIPKRYGSKRLIDNVMKQVEESYCVLINHPDPEGMDYRLAKKQHRNICVVATALIDLPLRNRTTVITAYGEGFERIVRKLEDSQTTKAVPKVVVAPKPLAKILRINNKMRVLDEICCKYRKKPVIIVPSSAMSIVCRQNIKRLLEDHEFVDPQESMRNDGPIVSSLPMNAVEVVHKICGRAIKFRVVENSYTTKFTTSDWISVVCVVLNAKGGQWQFNGYPFDSFVDMFLTIKCALFTYDTDNVPGEMANWDLKVFRINRSHRHHDASIAKEFWQYIESFLLQPRNRKIHPSKRLS